MYTENGSLRRPSDSSSPSPNVPIAMEEEDVTAVDPSILSFVEDQSESGSGLVDAEGGLHSLVEEDPTPDLYAVLGVSRDASEVELKAAYRRLSRLLHPDKHAQASATAEAAFARLTAAYNILSDPHRRAIYDQYGFKGKLDRSRDFSTWHFYRQIKVYTGS